MKTRVFLRRPDVPGFCPSNGVVVTVLTVCVDIVDILRLSEAQRGAQIYKFINLEQLKQRITF